MNFTKRSLIITFLISLISATTITAFFAQITEHPIAQVSIKKHRKIIQNMMPLTYSNDLLTDTIELNALSDLGTSEPVPVYRARFSNSRSATQPIGIVITPTAPDGYNGAIQLAISLNWKGEVLRVNILNHHESAGFGDMIHQDKTDWLKGFIGKSAVDFERNMSIDQISGASVSSYSVTQAVVKCLDLYQRDRKLFWKEKDEQK